MHSGDMSSSSNQEKSKTPRNNLPGGNSLHQSERIPPFPAESMKNLRSAATLQEGQKSMRRLTTDMKLLSKDTSSTRHSNVVVQEETFDEIQNRTCPHCRKVFAKPFSVTKHVQRIHNRAGELHCDRCDFKSHSQRELDSHERSKHRTCKYCKRYSFYWIDIYHTAKRTFSGK